MHSLLSLTNSAGLRYNPTVRSECVMNFLIIKDFYLHCKTRPLGSGAANGEDSDNKLIMTRHSNTLVYYLHEKRHEVTWHRLRDWSEMPDVSLMKSVLFSFPHWLAALPLRSVSESVVIERPKKFQYSPPSLLFCMPSACAEVNIGHAVGALFLPALSFPLCVTNKRT